MAASWAVTFIKDLMANPMVLVTEIDQCAYGLMSEDENGRAPARKPTRFLTNSVCTARELRMECRGCKRHVQLMNGRAGPAARYPAQLCRAVCKGVRNQMVEDAADLMSFEVIEESGGVKEVDGLHEGDA